MADVLANKVPVSCIPSPESPANRITMSFVSMTLCVILIINYTVNVKIFSKLYIKTHFS